MRKINKTLKNKIASDKYYQKCSRLCDGNCQGKITWEHAIIFAGRQLNEKWAIIPLCEYHHAVNQYQDGGDLNKEINVCIALNRATDRELLATSKAVNYKELKNRLNEKFKWRYVII